MSMPGTARIAQRNLVAIDIDAILCFLPIAALALIPVLGSLGALLFLAFGGLLIASRPLHSIRSLVDWWPLLLLPAYCVASILWSQYPGESLRYGIQLSITLAIAIVMAQRITAAQMVRCLFAALGLVAILCLLAGRTRADGTWLGVFESKNDFAVFVAVFAILSAGVLIDARNKGWLRALGFAGLVIAPMLLLRAQSAGATAATAPAVAATFAALLIGRLTYAQKVFVIAAGLIVAAATALVFVTYGGELLALLLESSGKDATLTGRTELWAAGFAYIAENPWLGVGFHAFWVEGNGPAEQLWQMFDQRSGAGFSFHNLYISNTVELGLVGIVLQLFAIYGAIGMLTFLALRRFDAATATFLGFMVLIVLRSFLEVDVFIEFNLRGMMVYFAFIYAVRANAQLAGETHRRATSASGT